MNTEIKYNHIVKATRSNLKESNLFGDRENVFIFFLKKGDGKSKTRIKNMPDLRIGTVIFPSLLCVFNKIAGETGFHRFFACPV